MARILAFGNNTAIEVPEKQVRKLSDKNRVPVIVQLVDYRYPSTITRMGGKFLIPFAKVHRDQTGLKGGSLIEVLLILDEGVRIVEVPKSLENRLKTEDLWDLFTKQSYSTRKELSQLILSAKKPETLILRFSKVIRILKQLKH